MTRLGAGLMIPAITLLTQRDVARTYPALHPALHVLGNPSEQTLVIGGMLAQDRAARRLLEIWRRSQKEVRRGSEPTASGTR